MRGQRLTRKEKIRLSVGILASCIVIGLIAWFIPDKWETILFAAFTGICCFFSRFF